MRTSLDQRRRQVADRHGGDAALRLRGLARIVDDERIGHWHRPQDRLGGASRAQGQGLAGQPFQRAVGAEMDHGMDALDLAQPNVEGQVGVARRQGRVMVLGSPFGPAATIRLHRDDEAAGPHDAKPEGALPHGLVGGGLAPGLADSGGEISGQPVQRPFVVGQRQHRHDIAFGEPCHQGGALRQVAHVEALLTQMPGYAADARR